MKLSLRRYESPIKVGRGLVSTAQKHSDGNDSNGAECPAVCIIDETEQYTV